MIDWAIVGTLLASIHKRRRTIEANMGFLCRESPRFQNIDYPLSPFPLAVAATRFDDHRETAEHYMNLLERVINLYHTSAEVRSYFGLRPEEENLVRADTRLTPSIRIARLDGYLAQGNSTIRFLENNTDCPAGILFTERLNLLVDRVIECAVAETGVKRIDMPFDQTDCARQELLAAYRQQGGTKTNPIIAILQISGKSNVESVEMAEEFSARGTPTFVADPREVVVSADGVRLEGREVDLIWNKVNTVYWNRLVADSPGLLGHWADVIASRETCHINPFAARYITESKLCSSFFQEQEFAHYFELVEREFLGRVLPWSRKLVAGKLVEYDSESWEISELLLARQADFVIKEPYDIRGDGVTIGRSVDRKCWVEGVDRAIREGHMAQEFIVGQTYPVLTEVREMEVLPMTTSFDSFMFGGRLSGLGSKAGLGHKVNLFQGGRKLAVRVYAPMERGTTWA